MLKIGIIGCDYVQLQLLCRDINAELYALSDFSESKVLSCSFPEKL